MNDSAENKKIESWNQMQIIPYNQQEHYDLLSRWWKGKPEHGRERLKLPIVMPHNTFVAMQNNTILASGSLILTDYFWGFLEFFIGNPEIRPELRADAIFKIADQLSEVAKSVDVKILYSHTGVMPIVEKAIDYGFRISRADGYSLVKYI